MKAIKHIEFELTNHCQLACVFCPHKTMQRPKGLMSYETLYNILNQIKDLDIKSAILHQIGESLIHPNVIEYINLIGKHIPFMTMSTNAMLLDANTSIKLFNSKLGELTLALDSLHDKNYELLRVGGDFNRVKGNIDRCLEIRKELGKKSNCKVELQVIVTKENIDEIPLFKKEYGWLDDEEWGFLRIKEFSTFAGNVEDISPTGIAPRRFTCPKLNSSMTIHWNGDIVFCCRNHESLNFTLGNVNTHNIVEVFNSPIYEKLRNKMRNKDFTNELEFCKNC